MADKKISALPPASTPLAGTEVLPIVQGGITEQVSVANLTAGRAVAASSISTTGDVYVGATGSAFAEKLRVFGNYAVLDNGTYTGFVGAGASIGAGGATDFSLRSQAGMAFAVGGTTLALQFSSAANVTVNTGNLVIGTAGKGITNSTGSVALNFSTAGTALTGGAQSVLTGSFNNVGTAQTVTPDDTRGGNIVITAIQSGIGSTTYTLPFVKRGGTVAIGTPSTAILTADPLTSVTASGGGIVITPVAANTYITYAIYYTPLGT
jgi:hypothetical protein